MTILDMPLKKQQEHKKGETAGCRSCIARRYMQLWINNKNIDFHHCFHRQPPWEYSQFDCSTFALRLPAKVQTWYCCHQYQYITHWDAVIWWPSEQVRKCRCASLSSLLQLLEKASSTVSITKKQLCLSCLNGWQRAQLQYSTLTIHERQNKWEALN